MYQLHLYFMLCTNLFEKFHKVHHCYASVIKNTFLASIVTVFLSLSSSSLYLMYNFDFWGLAALYCRVYAATIIDGVLDWQLDLLDQTQLHTITMYTLYNSQQLSLFSSSEDFGSTSATTAATSSYGIPCHYSLTGNCPRSSELYSPWTDPKENTSSIHLLLEWRHYRNGPQRKCWPLPLLHCLATVINNISTVDCWPTACMSHYVQAFPTFWHMLELLMGLTTWPLNSPSHWIVLCTITSLLFPLLLLMPHFHPEDGICNVYQNVGTAWTYTMVKPWKSGYTIFTILWVWCMSLHETHWREHRTWQSLPYWTGWLVDTCIWEVLSSDLCLDIGYPD
jgi:hypothetical protein